MSKELEALTYELSKKYPHDKTLQDYFCKVADLVNKTIPPTADELCEELGEYYGVKVMFVGNEFYYKDRYSNSNVGIVGLRTKKVNEKVVKNCVDFYPDLPPRLVKRIAQFYKSEVKE